MLVLTRRAQEAITIGDPDKGDVAVEIIVMEIRDDGVHLRIKLLRGGSAPGETARAEGSAATALAVLPARRR